MTTIRVLVLLLFMLPLVACGVVSESPEATTLEFRTSVILGLAALGIGLVLLGTYLLRYALGPRLLQLNDRPMRLVRTVFRFIAIPIMGGILIFGAFSFLSFRVEVRHDVLVMEAFPGGHRELRKSDISGLDRIEGGRRVRIRTTSGEEHFINAGEVGQDALDRVWQAIERSDLQ